MSETRRLEFSIEFDQPVLRVYHPDVKVRYGETSTSKYEFENMRIFKAFPAEDMERYIMELWNKPSLGGFISADDEFYTKLDAMEKELQAAADKLIGKVPA